MTKQRRSRLAIAAFVLSGILWGAGFPFGKVAFSQLGPAHVVLYRFLLASIVLLPIPLVQKAWPNKRDLGLFLVTGVLTVPVTFLLQFAGLTFTTAASAALIMGALPPILALGAVWFFGESLGRGGWLAVVASTVGVALVVGLPGEGSNWLGDGLVFLSAVTSAVAIIMSKDLMRRYPSLTATTYIIVSGTLFLIPASLAWDGPPRLHLSPAVWGAVLVLGLGSSALSYVFYNWGLAHFDASRSGVYLNLEPLVGAILGVTMLGEPLGPLALMGGALILGASYYVSRSGLG